MYLVLDANVTRPRGLDRFLKRYKKPVIQSVGEYWISSVFDTHFTQQAKTEYQHDPRNPKYQARKRRLGYLVDNLMTGRTRRFMRHLHSISATSTQVTVRMSTPIYQTKPKPGQPNTINELTRISASDREDMTKVYQKGFDQAMKLALGDKAANDEKIQLRKMNKAAAKVLGL